MKEIWKDIKGYEGLYKVSNKGRVKSLKRKSLNNGSYRIIGGNILKPRSHRQGYLLVALYNNSKRKDLLIHRIVAESFIKKSKNKHIINHIDANKSNNVAENLEWSNPSENSKHASKLKLFKPKKGEDNYKAKLKESDILEIRKKYKTGNYSQRYLAKLFNVCKTNIAFIVNNKHWTHI